MVGGPLSETPEPSLLLLGRSCVIPSQAGASVQGDGLSPCDCITRHCDDRLMACDLAHPIEQAARQEGTPGAENQDASGQRPAGNRALRPPAHEDLKAANKQTTLGTALSPGGAGGHHRPPMLDCSV